MTKYFRTWSYTKQQLVTRLEFNFDPNPDHNLKRLEFNIDPSPDHKPLTIPLPLPLSLIRTLMLMLMMMLMLTLQFILTCSRKIRNVD